MTFPSRAVEPRTLRNVPALAATGRGAWLALAALLLSCSDVAEWRRQESSLELYVGPLPPTTGEDIWVAVRAENVGPVDVLQGTTRLATFLGVDLRDGVTRQVTAISDETPEAVAVGYDFRELRVTARPFEDEVDPPPTEPDPDEEEVLVDVCPGAVDEPAPVCLAPQDTSSFTIRVHNRTDDVLNVVQYYPIGLTADQCVAGTIALVPPADSRTAEVTGGSMLGVLVDRTAQVLRAVALPDGLPADATCEFVIDP